MLQHDKQKITVAKIKDRSLCNEILGMERDNMGDIPNAAKRWSELMKAPNQLVLSKMRDVNGKFTLHHACEKQAPEHVIDILINSNKIAVGTKSDHDEYPLSLALRNHQPETVVLKIFRAFPEAAKYKDRSTKYYQDCYPLHMACNDDNDGIYGETLVRELIEAFPEAVRHKVRFGRYPLHLACYGYHKKNFNPMWQFGSYRSTLFKVIHELVKVFPDAVKLMDVDGMYPFYPLSLIKDEAPECLVETLLANNHVAIQSKTILSNNYVKIQTVTDRFNNPLLSSLQYHQLEPVVLKLLQAFPESAKQKDKKRGWYPLHFACYVGEYETLVIELIKVFPEAAKHMDYIGRYPLHLACYGNSEKSLQGIQELIKVFPEAAKHMDDKARYPLHLACSGVHTDEKLRFPIHLDSTSVPISSLQVIQELIKVFPDAVRYTDLEDNYPLFGALSHFEKSTVAVKELVEELFPDESQHKYGQCLEWFPLNHACLCSTPDIAALQLIELYPQAAKEKQCHGWYPLHFACLYSNLSEAVAIKLIELFPDAVQQKTNHDEYPLHIACEHNGRLPIIKALVSQYPEALLEYCVGDESGQKFLPLDLARTKQIVENIKFLRDATANQLKHRKACSESSNALLLEETEDKDHDDCGQGKMKRKKI